MWDLIMEDYVALKNKMMLLKELLIIKKYDDNKTKKIIDDIKGADKTWTMLNMEKIFSFWIDYVACGDWDDRYCQVLLASLNIVDQYSNARFRASVMVDAPS